MVKVKEASHYLADGNIDLEAWLQRLDERHHYLDLKLIRNACMLAQVAAEDLPTESGESCLQQGLAMAEILLDLEVDAETLAAAIIYDSMQYTEMSLDDVEEQLGARVAKLVSGVERMNAISNIGAAKTPGSQRLKVDNIRKMLLAMVDDVRGVLIKLAERLRVLRAIAPLPDAVKQEIARETFDIYAPLANRLGIGAIKWEMEDLSFRYLQPEKYKEIAKGLKARRLDRDKYVNGVVDTLSEQLKSRQLKNFKVYGRSKHIHSIYRKMNRKNLSLDEIYDATAVRVLVDKDEDCYTVLSTVHELWTQIPQEYDDYISNPKGNGYRSLHTAVIGSASKHFEVQIRTYQMHAEAEMGVAAHWKYKEGGSPQKERHEQKIEWLRDVLEWQRELIQSGEGAEAAALETEFLDDRVYIFTPGGDVIDLPQGSTPLDFAYHIHSEVGHRCRGAKVDGRMVQLTHALHTGEQVEVITGNEARPSRDWLNPHLNYLKSSRAKAKIHHWFNQQDYDKNCEEGTVLLERELKRFELKPIGLLKIAKALNFKKKSDMLAAVGRGDLRFSPIINRLREAQKPEETEEEIIAKVTGTSSRPPKNFGDVQIEGVGNLLTHMAKCCQPVPGDDIIGYITLGRGVSIHRDDCVNILHASDEQKVRFIQVSWGETSVDNYKVDIVVHAYDRASLLRDITQLLASEKANVFALSTNINKDENTAVVHMTVEVSALDALSRLLDKLKQVPNVVEAKRQS